MIPPPVAIQAAKDVLQKCAAYDPWFPHPTEAMILAWAEQIARTNLTRDDLLAGVTECYRTRGSGFKPLPADITDAARAIRHDRFQRQPLEQIEAHNDRNVERLAAMVTELAETKTVDRALKQYARPAFNPLRVACPHCHAPISRPCTAGINRMPLRCEPRYHPSRLEAAAGITTPPPAPPPPPPPGDTDTLCALCGQRELATDNEIGRGVCDPCWPSINGHPQPNGNTQTA